MKIGIDLGGSKTEGILLNNDGNELIRKRIKTEKNYQGTKFELSLNFVKQPEH